MLIFVFCIFINCSCPIFKAQKNNAHLWTKTGVFALGKLQLWWSLLIISKLYVRSSQLKDNPFAINNKSGTSYKSLWLLLNSHPLLCNCLLWLEMYEIVQNRYVRLSSKLATTFCFWCTEVTYHRSLKNIQVAFQVLKIW